MNTDNIHKLVDGRPGERAYAAILIGQASSDRASTSLDNGKPSMLRSPGSAVPAMLSAFLRKKAWLSPG